MFDVAKCLRYVEEKHFCPHCSSELSCCHAPPFHVGDGLGWGTEFFFVCLNDECSLFVNSWKQFEEMFGHRASCRYMVLPGETSGQPMMVAGREAFKGCVVNPESLLREDERYRREKESTAQLDASIEDKNIGPAMSLILDEMASSGNRSRACDALEMIGDLACVDAIRNHPFRNKDYERKANEVADNILKKNYMKECPYCAELIKAKAGLCKHCGKEV